MENCSADYYDYGGIDDSKFDEPLPWIGLYVAATSLVCAVLMAVDLVHKFKRRTPWSVSKYFAFNVITITLLAKATKLPSDITGGMSGLVDQLTKLSGLVLLRGAMDHAMSSLGAMDSLTAISNLTALGIMVVYMFINIWIQLNSGVIFNYYFRCIYIYYSLDMVLIFLFLGFHTLSIFPSRRILYKQYYKIHEKILNDGFSHDKVLEYVKYYWLMAVTSSPAYTLTTSQLAVASSCLNGYSSVLIFVFGITFVSGKIRNGNNPTCFVRSYYSWSTWLIFIIQVFTIAVGCATSFDRIVRSIQHTEWFNTYKIENYMVEFVKDWNDAPLPVSNMVIQRVHYLRGKCIDALIFLFRIVMITSHVIVVIHLCFANIIIIFCRSAKMLILRIFRMNHYSLVMGSARESDLEDNDDISILQGDNDVRESPYGDMSDYILYLTDKKDVEQSRKIAGILQTDLKTWIKCGRDDLPTNLYSLLKRDSPLPEAFKEVHLFYSKQISLTEHPNCWAMPIVTLASILFLHDKGTPSLLVAVEESLRYIRFIDKNMDQRGTGRMQKTAKKVAEKLYLQKKWSNVDRDQASSMTFTVLLTRLRDNATNDSELDGHCNSWEYWPQEVFIKKCMCATTDVILKSLENGEASSSNSVWSVERLEKVMVGLLGACLTNLPRAIFKHCSSGTFGLREEKVKKAAAILGETEKIITLLLEDTDLRNHIPADKKYIESWSGR